MKTLALLLLVIAQIQNEEVPIPQGPGTLIEQLGTQQIVEGNYRDTTAWRQQTLQTDYEGDIEEIQQKPRIITERVTAPPKVLTERVTTEPRYITERVEAPVKQRIITQPTVMNEYIRAEPQFIRGQDQNINRDPVYLPTKYDTQVINKPVNVPGNTVTNNTYVQPVSKTIREEIQIQNAPEIRRDLEPIQRDVQTQNFDRTRTVQVPANYVYRQDVIQPIYQRENVSLNIQQAPGRTINKEPVTLPAQFEQKTVTKNVNIPGGTIYKQQTIYPTVTNEQVEMSYQRSEPVYREAPVKELEPVVRRTSSQINHQVVHQVPQFQNVPVPVPTLHRVPEFKDVPIRFKMPALEDHVIMNVRDIEYDVEELLAQQGHEKYMKRVQKKKEQKKKEAEDDDYYGHSYKGEYKMNSKGYGYNNRYNPDISNLF